MLLNLRIGRGLLNQYIAAVAASLCVVTSGNCNGWIAPILNHLLGPESEIPMTPGQASWAISIIEVGNLISPLPAAILCNYIGRKPVILATGPLYIISWLMIIYFPSALMLGVARFFQGLVMGLVFTAVPVYLGEIASNATRGAITSLFFNSWWLGFLVEYAVGPYLSYYTFTYFTLAINIPFIIAFLWQPESPYYYMMAGNDEKAYESLKWLRDSTPEELNDELQEIKCSVESNQKSAKVQDIIATAVDRKAFYLLNVLTAVRILSGTGGILVYATRIFDLTPNLHIPSDTVTIGVGLVLLAGGCISFCTSDTLGRRPLLLISCIGSFVCQFCTGTLYFFMFNTSYDFSNYSWIAPFFILVYSGLCSAGLYPVCAAYTSELFCSHTRGIAASFSAMTYTVFSFITLMTFQPITDWMGLYANFYLYSLVSFFGILYFYFVAPETKGKSFVQIRNELCKLET